MKTEYKDLSIKDILNDLKHNNAITKKNEKFFKNLEKFKDFL